MKIIGKVFIALCNLFLIWVLLSFINTNMHNQPFEDGYKDYADWNFFSIVFGGEYD